MWLLDLVAAAEEVPAPPPAIPSETVGIVLVALVTGITGIIVALIQRGKKDSRQATATPVAVAFVISKEDWTEVRDSVHRIDALLDRHLKDYDYHERRMQGETNALAGEVNRIKGHLGIQ